MGTALWIATGLIGVAFTVGGLSQVLMSKEKYRSYGPAQHWVDDFTEGHLTAIGVVKLVGVAGLVLPPLVGIAPVLSPVAATCLALVMAGAATTRFRRSEWAYMAGDVGFLLALAFIAWGRFVAAPFG